MALVGKHIHSSNRRPYQPDPERYARQPGEPDGHDQVGDWEEQYNRQDQKAHRNSLLNALVIVVTHVSDAALADRIARVLIDDRLAACVNIGAPVESIYHWQGRTETAREIPLAAKTRATLVPAVEAAILRLHPYDIPEIIAIPVVGGHARYFAWVDTETRVPEGDGGQYCA
ncbi:MAG: divalent-cation tolerance protein CutA [Casimicrobiaceae bacterium]